MEDGQTSSGVAPEAVVVVGLEFTYPDFLYFRFTTGRWFAPNEYYRVKNDDGNGAVVFKVKGFRFTGYCHLLDAAGITLLTMKPKAHSRRQTCRVFRGNSTRADYLLFNVRQPKTSESRDNFEVVLGSKAYDEPCDFTIVVEDNMFKINRGQSADIIAQAVRCEKNKLRVSVIPNVDHAFIVSLIAILEEINASGRQSSVRAAAGAGAVTLSMNPDFLSDAADLISGSLS